MLKQLGFIVAAASVITVSAESQTTVPTSVYSYADLADRALAAPVVAQVRVTRASRLKPGRSPGVPAGHSRFYVEAQVVSLIRGAGGLPATVAYLADLPNAPGGKPVRLRKGNEWLVFADPVPGRAGELRLRGTSGQIPFQPTVAARLRGILTEASRPDAAPAIVGIGRAFHAPGSLPGESETQIFLQTAEQRPVSLSILRRPGETPRWSVALAEVVDETAAAPARDTLLWYRLACTLPRALPAQSLADLGEQESAAIRAEYNVVLQSLGSCPRTARPAQPGRSSNEARSTPTPAQSG